MKRALIYAALIVAIAVILFILIAAANAYGTYIAICKGEKCVCGNGCEVQTETILRTWKCPRVVHKRQRARCM